MIVYTYFPVSVAIQFLLATLIKRLRQTQRHPDDRRSEKLILHPLHPRLILLINKIIGIVNNKINKIVIFVMFS